MMCGRKKVKTLETKWFGARSPRLRSSRIATRTMQEPGIATALIHKQSVPWDQPRTSGSHPNTRESSCRGLLPPTPPLGEGSCPAAFHGMKRVWAPGKSSSCTRLGSGNFLERWAVWAICCNCWYPHTNQRFLATKKHCMMPHSKPPSQAIVTRPIAGRPNSVACQLSRPTVTLLQPGQTL